MGHRTLVGGCQQELNDVENSCEERKKRPLHCAGAEEEINRRCHHYVQFICFARDVKGLGNFFLILLADSPY
jgi:hypothetical protein